VGGGAGVVIVAWEIACNGGVMEMERWVGSVGGVVEDEHAF
jgi:hypothetical protein